MFNFRYIKDQESFYATRQRGLGASEVFILAGYGQRYTRLIDGKEYPLTPHVLWLEKTGRIEPFRGNEYTYWGNRLEGLVMDEFIRRNDRRNSIDPAGWIQKTEFVHPHYPWAISHPDLIHDTGELIQEIKTGSFFGAKRRDNPDYGYDPEDFSASGIPASVYLQLQWQMFTSDIRQAGVAILIDTSKYREYGPVGHNKKVIEQLLARGEKFWWHVKKDVEPTPESFGDVQLIWPEVKKTAAIVSGDALDRVLAMKEQHKKIAAAKKKLDKKEEEIKAALGLLINENAVLTGPSGEELVKQSVWQESRLSLKKLKQEHPWLYKRAVKYANTFEKRRLYF